MKEKDLQTKWNLYVRNRWNRGSAAFELKICHEKSMPFTAVKEHQLRNLHIAKHGRFTYKIADVGYDQKPFDSFVLQGSLAYVVVMFYKRGEKKVYLIDVDQYHQEMEESNRRSLTEERAGEIGEVIYMQ